jgi:hypothetical protein
MIAKFMKAVLQRRGSSRGVVTAEYLILLTLVGIGVIVGLAVVRNSLVQELCELAQAISAIITP